MMDIRSSKDAVVIEHSFDAPVELIWQMWTDPDHFRAWYGPEGASIPTAKMDVRVGGSRLVCMEVQTPSGLMQMWFTGEYLEGHPTTTEVRVELDAVGAGTRMILTHTGIPEDSPGAAGWRMAIAKLTDYLKARQ